jgi:predicted transcriptional regulator
VTENNPQKEIIEVLSRGRANPHHIRENTSINTKETVQYHLRQLRADERVEKVNRGLYTIVEDVDEDYEPPHATLDDTGFEFRDEG